MRVMVIVKATEDTEMGTPPTAEAMAAMHEYGNDQEDVMDAAMAPTSLTITHWLDQFGTALERRDAAAAAVLFATELLLARSGRRDAFRRTRQHRSRQFHDRGPSR